MHTLTIIRDINGNKRIQCKNSNGQSFSIQRPTSWPCIGMGVITEDYKSEYYRLKTYVMEHGTKRQKAIFKNEIWG